MGILNKTRKDFIFQLIRPYRLIIVLVIASSFLASVFEGFSIGMLVPFLSSIQEVQDSSSLSKPLQVIVNIFDKYSFGNQILFSISLALAGILLKNLFLAISMRLGYWLSEKLVADLRSQATDTLMEVGVGFYDKSKSGRLIEQVLGHTRRLGQLFEACLRFIVHCINFLVLFILLFILSWKLTLISIVLTGVIAFLLSGYINSLSTLSAKLAGRTRDMSGELLETITGIRLIKSLVKEKIMGSIVKEKIEDVRKDEYRLQFKQNMIHIYTEVLGLVVITVVFLVGLIRYDLSNKILITQLIPFIYVINRLLVILKSLNQTKGGIVGGLPFVDLTHDLIRRDNKPMITDGELEFPGLKEGVYFKSVTFSYSAEDKPALSGVDFFLPQGKTTALVGESGSGKSTVINLLLRFYDPQGGEILLDETPLRRFRLDSYRKRIGIVSQDTFIFNDTVGNNIAFGAHEAPTDEEINEAARKAGAYEFIRTLPNGYDTILGDKGIRLSGGERQRISIARAILKNPDILVLDEATSALDTRTEKLIHDAIYELSRNKTVVIIAHRLSTIKAADQIIVLKGGCVAEAGNEAELMEKQGEYYSLVQHQHY